MLRQIPHSSSCTIAPQSHTLNSSQALPKFHQFHAPQLPDAKICVAKSWLPSKAMAASLPLCLPPLRHSVRANGLGGVQQRVFAKRRLALVPVPKLERLGCAHSSRHCSFQAGFIARCSASSSPSGDATPADIPAHPEDSDGTVNTSRWKPRIVRVAIGVALVAIALAVSVTLLRRNRLGGSNSREASQLLADLRPSEQSASQELSQFTVNWFGRRISLAEKSPGYMYFLLLMAAGFGLFVSEEALNIWVGGTLGRLLTWNQSRDAFMSSVSENLPYIASTVVWVYWGVCISDMVPYYAGRQAAKSGTGNLIREKLGVSQEKFDQVRANVQRYGNLIGIVERFSLGVRNPTSFLAGFLGIKAINFFAGVCVGGLLTLPLQIGLGLLLRDRPVAALAGVAAVVGIWTVIPYMAAGIGSIMFFTRQRGRKESS